MLGGESLSHDRRRAGDLPVVAVPVRTLHELHCPERLHVVVPDPGRWRQLLVHAERHGAWEQLAPWFGPFGIDEGILCRIVLSYAEWRACAVCGRRFPWAPRMNGCCRPRCRGPRP